MMPGELHSLPNVMLRGARRPTTAELLHRVISIFVLVHSKVTRQTAGAA